MKQKKYRVIIVCGRRGSGKSHFVKEVLLKNYAGDKLILDVNNEYKDGILVKPDKFIDLAKNSSNCIIVFEEATMYMSNKGDIEEIRWLNVQSRHKANTLVYVFHGLQYIPLNILNQADLLVLLKTGDNRSLVERKFSNDPRIFNAFMKLQRSVRKYDKELVSLR